MTTEAHERRETHKSKRPPRQKRNPIATAIASWYMKHASHIGEKHTVNDLIAQAPKRWTAYGPLVLLPAGSFTSAAWRELLDHTSRSPVPNPAEIAELGNGANERNDGPALLWKSILSEISGQGASKLTHLAVNEGIPLHSKDSPGTETRKDEAGGGGENILRSPSGLRVLYGDFGPSTLPSSPSSSSPRGGDSQQQIHHETGGKEGEHETLARPTRGDFARAFWVSTRQNGITQTWAPRWTMFSRGNVKEKARLLAFHDGPAALAKSGSDPNDDKGGLGREDLSHRYIPAPQRKDAVAVDLYAGIGYFTFSYAAAGFRVFCWELNPWSVEGLRRGAEMNGWGVRVVVPPTHSTQHRGTRDQIGDGGEGVGTAEEEEDDILRDVLAGSETIVVFLEDNARAVGRLRRLDRLSQERGHGDGGDTRSPGFNMRNVMHVNLGLLPSSQLSWPTAWEIAREAPRAWVHVHENVGVDDIDAKSGEIKGWFTERARDLERSEVVQADVSVEHVELVKTFAPGVWHCVFDLCIRRDVDKGVGVT